MAEVQPLRALHYALDKTDGLQNVVAPPYDVIDAEGRAALKAQSPYNVVEIDLPVAADGSDPYAHAASVFASWRADGIVVHDDTPAIWPLEQDYVGPDGQKRTRRGFLARVRVEDYGPGRIRPHERTHPGPKEDRLRLTRATKATTSPPSSRCSPTLAITHGRHSNRPRRAPRGPRRPTGRHGQSALARHRPGRRRDVQKAASEAELLIADGHHRYETARVYAEEIGGEGEHRYVLMCLVALEDPGLTVFPTHRLVNKLTSEQWDALDESISTHFTLTELGSSSELPPSENEKLELGYIDVRNTRPYRLTLKDQPPSTVLWPAARSRIAVWTRPSPRRCCSRAPWG